MSGTFAPPRRLLLIAAAVAGALGIAQAHTGAQQQASAARSNWPCGARVDPAYFHLSEATGGHLFLLAPFEIGDSAPLLLALDQHPQTVLRIAGSITPGVHQFQVPIDSSVDSVVFSISVQCLQNAEVLRPSGDLASGPDVTDYANFRAERMVIVQHPSPGTWTLRAGGSGLAGVMVQATSGIALTRVEFAAPGADFRPTPTAGVENTLRLSVSGEARDLQASMINAAARTIAHLALTAGDDDATFTSRFTPGADAFRISVSGRDTRGLPFQRVHPMLLTAR
jgi:hypothetical protein